MFLKFILRIGLFNLIILWVVHTYFPAEFDTSLQITISLSILILALAVSLIIVTKKSESHSLTSVGFLIIKFLSAGIVFIVFYLNNLMTPVAGFIFSAMYLIYTALFSGFLIRVNASKNSLPHSK